MHLKIIDHYVIQITTLYSATLNKNETQCQSNVFALLNFKIEKIRWEGKGGEWERNPGHSAHQPSLVAPITINWEGVGRIKWKFLEKNINPVLCKLSSSYKLQRYLENVEKLRIFPFFTILVYFLENLKSKPYIIET